ncbi:MAG TPA: beta-N-acetylhexosaminidase [Thermoanaerobaculia bacterium]|nr:beta-N-acetylhexosaminidase [Thermoanaerobaculia bacterium]
MRAAEHVFVGIPGKEVSRAAAALLAKHQPGGVVLFERNIGGGEQLVELIAELRRRVPELVVAVDAEGGRVDRLKNLVGPAPAPALLARRSPTVALQAGRWIAQSLRLFDFDVDLAPVVDLNRGERGNALDDRYLGSRGALVTPRARAFLRGLHSGGIGGCLKHFPGLGSATEDTHFKTAVVPLPAAALAADLKPYNSLLALADAVMVAHAVYPAYDPDNRPASLSPPIIQDLLREKMGFDGLVFSDDLEMKALDDWGDLPARCEAAFAAGCDVLLATGTLEALPDIVGRLGKPKHSEHRRAAHRRLETYRQRLRTLRWASDSVSLVRDRSRYDRLEAVREGLAEMQA